MEFNIELQDEYVKLRPVKKEDYIRFLPLTKDKSLWTYFTEDLSNEKTLKNWVDDAIAQFKSKTRLAFAIIAKSQNQIVGSTSFGNISECDKRIEIGWTWIGKYFQGKGFNQHGKYLMLKYCFEELGLERVELKTDVLNIPARKAMLKIGLTEEGILRSHTQMINNRRRDTIYYSILKSEFEEVKFKNNWT